MIFPSSAKRSGASPSVLPPMALSVGHSCFFLLHTSQGHFHENPNLNSLLPYPSPRIRLTLKSAPSLLLRKLGSLLRSSGNEGMWEPRNDHNEEEEEPEEEEELEEKVVHCEVDVISWRERRIRASITVETDEQTVWDVLTDYGRLAEFVPNLICSERIPCPHPGRIWLMQRGMQRALYWHIEARVVLDLQELPDAAAGKELHFCMVDGDFMKFEGKWSLKAGLRPSTTNLSYELNVIPRFNYPAIFIERIIRSDLPVNLQAIASRAEKKKASLENAEPSSSNSNGSFTKHKLGPLSDPPSEEHNNKWGVYGKVCRLDRICMADEVHLRRCDDLLENGGVHRSVTASITVKAPVRRVWNVLTNYETLPEFVPNLAISKILSREKNKVRILQEGCKGLLYMVLHARVVLDLCEQLEQEVSFEQVEGDFDSFRGKWILEQLGNHHTLLKYVVDSKMQKNSFLSEAIVEEVIYEDLPSNLCAIRDRIEETDENQSVCTIDGPDIYHRVLINSELNMTQSKVGKDVEVINNNKQNGRSQRPKVPGLQKDFGILKSELQKYISEHGQEGFMPMRKQLRLDGRIDLEKAITHAGGFRHVASRMNLSLAYKHRKPKGYWDNLDNLHEEISHFQMSWGMDPNFMPSKKSFERAGRYDLARALEKWGGLQEVSRLLSLKLRHRRTSNASKQKRSDPTSDQVSHGLGKVSCKSHVSQNTQKWLMTLKNLDINWIE